MKIVTFNLSCDWDTCDGINSFVHRAGMIYEKLNSEMPDIVAFQEVVPKSLGFLKSICPDYDFYGQFRSEGFDGEGLFTAVRKDKFEVTAHEAFWMSPTPYVPGSRFAGQSECPRICVVTDIRDIKSGFRLRLFNVHSDHISDEARTDGIKCVLNKVTEYNKKNPLNTAVAGDFNALPESESIKLCRKYGFVDLTDEQKCTFHEFGQRKEKLDYIFADKNVAELAGKSFVWEDEKHGVYLSDHYPTGIVLKEAAK